MPSLLRKTTGHKLVYYICIVWQRVGSRYLLCAAALGGLVLWCWNYILGVSCLLVMFTLHIAHFEYSKRKIQKELSSLRGWALCCLRPGRPTQVHVIKSPRLCLPQFV